MSEDLLHGGALDIMLGLFPYAPTPWIDMSTGINPWPYPFEDILPTVYHRLPTQAAYHACQQAMAGAIKAPMESLLLAAGSEILIRLLPTLLSPKKVAVLSPSYGDHAHVWKTEGCEVIQTPDPLKYSDEANIVVICNPNNPNGRLFDRQELEQARLRLAARGGWLVVDEAYTDLDLDRSLAPQGGDPALIILRSLGKFYGLAGVRLGAMIAPSGLRVQMSDRLGVWNISGPALYIAARAYRDIAWQAQMRKNFAAARKRLDKTLNMAGIVSITGTDLYRYIHHDKAQDLWTHLAHSGIYVRRFADCSTHLRFGLPPDIASETRLRETLRRFNF